MRFDKILRRWWPAVFGIMAMTAGPDLSAHSDQETVAALDSEYQDAVRRNDAVTMGRILADDFILVTSSARIFTRADLLEEARSGRYVYERQDDSDRTVRLWGDTAVVTAKLWAKGTESGKPFDYKLWFSDIYVRTPDGWRYVFAQVGGRAPEPAK